MAKINYNDIPNINTPWENYAGSSVEKFIKGELNNRCGYIYRSNTKEGDYYYLYGFTDYEQYEAWAGGDSSIIPLFKVQLPNVENDTFSVNLTTNSNTQKLVNLGDGVKINLRYTSTATNPTSGVVSDTYNDGTLIISRSANGSAYQEVGRLIIQPTPWDNPSFREYDITRYLVDGDNKIRLRVEDNVNGSISSNITFQSIINTTLRIENATPTSQPLSALQLQYYIEGQVAKTLHIRITQGGSVGNFEYPIGTSTYIEVPYTTPLMNMNLESGTINVDSWLSVDDTELVSYHEINQFYYSDGSDTNTIIILNNVSDAITNYTNTHLFDMALYNQGADVDVYVRSTDAQTEYLHLSLNNCQVGTVYPVYATLEIESLSDSISAVVSVESENFNCEPYLITIDNTEKMSPTAGADFVLNPKVRNNSENTPNRIINAVNGAIIPSVFTGFDFINDGWVSDEDGIQVLRIPAGNSLSIAYDVLDNLSSGTTFEIDFKTSNIFNDNDTILSISSLTNDDKPLGFIMNPTECAFYTIENQTKRDQDVIFQEEERTHMAVNIVKNLANSGLNYIRIFVNGVMNREIQFTNTDIFKNGTLSILIGAQNSDIDIYGIRVYKKGLSASDVRQDYMSSIPTSQEKIEFKDANDILSSNGTISYDKAKVKYNTLVWTGRVPSKLTGDVSYEGKLYVDIIGDDAHSGEITNLKIKGQGSSSKGYWKWNHQYDMDKLESPSVFTNKNGETFSGYALTENDPEAKKLVAKLNWASSMQSHKLGSTSMYTDFWKEIVGGNSITATQGYENVRVSVHEKPFLYFVKDNDSSQPVFYGLMTFGSGKFDKPTFGYDKNVFPDYLILEGSDNGMPLTLRQVPWVDGEVVYNAGEEYYEYAGQGNLDYGMGKQENISYFQTAFNFTYLHSPRLMAYTQDSELLDTSYQYWNTSTKNVKRYDWISNTWVDAGIINTTPCEYHAATQEDVNNNLASNVGEKVIDVLPVYEVLNLESQTGLLRSSYSSDADYTAAVINWRVNDFKNKVNLYYNTNDVLYSMSFLKLIAASDNWCKNTYEYLDPVSHKICLAQDDMDTLFLTDNVGRKTKPYYVEEHDIDGENKPYFNGSTNNFFCLMEKAFEAEEKNMMRQIFNTMRSKFETPQNCIQHYFFNTQQYFPAVAYNETARLLYEEASVAESQGIYDNATPPITQSLGDQLQAEKQWWKRRFPYMQSWSSADPFYVRSTVEPNVMFRSMTTVAGNDPTYQFTLTPWQWLYPKVGTGQYLSTDTQRVPALTQYTTVLLATDGNTDTYIYGSDYYTNLGEFGGVSLSEAFRLNGKRLLSFSADSRNVVSYEFRPRSMTVNCPALRTLTLYGCSTLSGVLDLSGCTKLESLDLRGTGLSSVILPETGTLTTVYLPSLTSITIVNCPNIQTLSIEGYSNILSLTTDISSLATEVIGNAPNLSNVVLYNVNITTNSNNVDEFVSLLTSETSNCQITGAIYLDTALSNSQISAIEDKFGESVWNPSSAFYISFIYSNITSLSLSYASGYGSLFQNDSMVINVITDGNNIRSYTWTLTNTIPLTTVKSRGQLVINTTTFNTVEEFTATLSITTTNGQTLTSSIDITACYLEFTLNNQALRNSVIDVIEGWNGYAYSWSKYATMNENLDYSGTVEANESGLHGVGVYFDSTLGLYQISGAGQGTDGNLVSTCIGFVIDSTYYVYVPFEYRENLIEIEISQISDIQCLNGSATYHVSWNFPSEYSQYISISGTTLTNIPSNKYTISNVSNYGCDIALSGVDTSYTSRLYLDAYYNDYINTAYIEASSNSFNISNTETGFFFNATYSGPSSFSNSSDTVASIMNNPSGCNNYYLFSNDSNCKGLPTQSGNIVLKGEYRVKINSTNTTYTLSYDATNDRYYVEDPTDNTKVLMYMQNEAKPTLRINQNAFNSSSDESVVVYAEYPKTYIDANGTTRHLDQNQEEYLFSSNNYLTDIYLEQPSRYVNGNSTSFASFGHYMCQNCLNLVNAEVKFTDSGDSGSGMFKGCTNLTSVVISNVSTIDNNAFQNCTSLTSFTINGSLYSINTYAFNGCSSLTSINLPSTLRGIGDYAFSQCSKMSIIIINSSTAPTISNYTWGYNTYTTGYSSGATNVLYVPSNATGYDATKWTAYLLNSSYGKFTLSKTL